MTTRMKKLASILSLVLVLVLFVFVVQNLGTTKVNFLAWEWKMSLAAPVLGAYILGGLTFRPLFRLLNGQRKQRKTEKKARSKAESDLKKQNAQAAREDVPSNLS